MSGRDTVTAVLLLAGLALAGGAWPQAALAVVLFLAAGAVAAT